MNAIEVEQLSRSFNGLKAVDNISFTVEAGEIFGFLGHNGAGKTTTIRMLSGQLLPTSGQAQVAGCNVITEQDRLRPLIGVVSEHQNLYERMSGRENLEFAARLYGQNFQRVNETLAQVGLLDRAKDNARTYSNGMKQRLVIARALIHRPQIIFLDEPTRGLDPVVGREIRRLILDLSEQGVTIFLTTHYMEEADQLCDRIGIIDHGQIQIIDTPENMKHAMGNEVISVKFESKNPDDFLSQLHKIEYIKKINKDNDKLTIFTSNGTQVIPEIFKISSSLEIKIISISLTQPTLDDVFISYTGREMRDDDAGFNRKREHAKMKRLRA